MPDEHGIPPVKGRAEGTQNQGQDAQNQHQGVALSENIGDYLIKFRCGVDFGQEQMAKPGTYRAVLVRTPEHASGMILPNR